MTLLLLFVIGFIITFVGTLPFGIINTSVADIAIRKGLRQALLFGAGASFIEGVKITISTKFSYIFLENELFASSIQWIAIFIFFTLGTYYIVNNPPEKGIPQKTYKYNKGWAFKGMALNLLNLVAYPFWILLSSFLIEEGWMNKTNMHFATLAIGATLGSFALFALYAKWSIWLSQKYSKAAKYMSMAFASVFILTGLILLIKQVFF